MKGMVIKMSKYTPIFKKKYPNGFVDAPPKETPLTAEIFNNYDEALTAIESFLSELPETTEDSNEDTGTDIDLENLVATNSISLGRKADTDIGVKSTAEGKDVTASAYTSHAEGDSTTASASSSHAEGYKTTASGGCSHAEGRETTASHFETHAEGYCTTASGNVSHAEGRETTASGDCSHAEGCGTTASYFRAHAEGYYTTADGYNSHAEGEGTIASGNCSHAQGKYNIEVANKYAHIVGNGTSDTARSNAHTLDWLGNAWFAGDVYIGGTGQDDENVKKLASEQYVLDQIAELNAAIEELNNKLSSLSSTASE